MVAWIDYTIYNSLLMWVGPLLYTVKNCQSPEDYEFGSPLVDVRISPLLAVPHNVLGRICEYLKGLFSVYVLFYQTYSYQLTPLTMCYVYHRHQTFDMHMSSNAFRACIC